MKKNNFPKKWIFLRGLARSRFHWKGFDQQFAQQLNLEQVCCAELLGNGYYHLEKTPSRIEVAIQHLKSQVSFNWSEPVGLFGISLGGMIATKWCQLEPQLFSHLVLANSSSNLSPFYQRFLIKNYSKILTTLLNYSPEHAEKLILNLTSNFEENKIKSLAENIAFAHQHPMDIQNFLQQLKLAKQINFKETPSQNKLILASRNDRLVSPHCSETIANTWNCPIYFNEMAGHDLSLDAGDWIINKIRTEFINVTEL